MRKFDIPERLLYFYSLLNRTYEAQVERDDPAARGIAAVMRALLADYDRLFSPNTLKASMIELTPLVKKHCHPWPGCPICAAEMHLRASRHGNQFYGCSRYPDCRGGRSDIDPYPPTINDAMRLFLTEKELEETIQDEQIQESRFLNLDL